MVHPGTLGGCGGSYQLCPCPKERRQLCSNVNNLRLRVSSSTVMSLRMEGIMTGMRVFFELSSAPIFFITSPMYSLAGCFTVHLQRIKGFICSVARQTWISNIFKPPRRRVKPFCIQPFLARNWVWTIPCKKLWLLKADWYLDVLMGLEGERKFIPVLDLDNNWRWQKFMFRNWFMQVLAPGLSADFGQRAH